MKEDGNGEKSRVDVMDTKLEFELELIERPEGF
jgi:hypothetical protein